MGKKKEKVTYIDDGRTLADMSNVGGRRLSNRSPIRPDAKEIWKTYWSAVKMMFVPMLIFMAGLGILYLIAYLILMYA